MAPPDRRPSVLVPVVVALAAVVVAGSLVRFVFGTVVAAIRLLTVIVVAVAVLAVVVRRRTDR